MAEAVAGAVPSDNELVVGVVTSVSPLTVLIRGAQVTRSLGVLGSYVPTVGDNVQVIRQDASWLILGVGNNGTDATLTLANYNGNTAAATTVLANFSNVNRVRFPWTKRFATTRVRVDLSVSCFTSAVTTKPRFGIDFINVTAVPPSPRVNMMEMLINTANEHTTLSAQDVFSGFGVGTYQVQLIWLRVAGAGTLTINADDWVSLMVAEVA
jgi:hypothetical protein